MANGANNFAASGPPGRLVTPGAQQPMAAPTPPPPTAQPAAGGNQLQSLIQQFQQQQEAARQANEQRYQQALGIYQGIEQQYAPGGAFEQAALQQLGQQRQQTLAAQQQGLVGAGLAGTTVAANLPAQFAQQVEAPYRLQLQAQQQQALAQARAQTAGLVERREDIGPSPELIAGLTQQAAQAPVTQQQYTAERKRRQSLKRQEGRSAKAQRRIESLQKKLGTATDEKQRMKIQAQLDKAQSQYETIQTDISGLGDAQISDYQFGTFEQNLAAQRAQEEALMQARQQATQPQTRRQWLGTARGGQWVEVPV